MSPWVSCFSCVRLFVTLWTTALRAPLSMGFSRQEYWGGLPCPPPGDLPDPGIQPITPALAGGFQHHLGSPLYRYLIGFLVNSYIINLNMRIKDF